eukprot:7592734-Karenia_brevis.AAC.1
MRPAPAASGVRKRPAALPRLASPVESDEENEADELMARLVRLRPDLAEVLRKPKAAEVGAGLDDDGDEDWVDLQKDKADALDFARGRLLQIDVTHRRTPGRAYVRIGKVYERNKSGILCSYAFSGASTVALSKLLEATDTVRLHFCMGKGGQASCT